MIPPGWTRRTSLHDYLRRSGNGTMAIIRRRRNGLWKWTVYPAPPTDIFESARPASHFGETATPDEAFWAADLILERLENT